MEIDIVFTYVDCEDKKWLMQKNEDLEQPQILNNQFNSNLDEIKFAVLSIEKYFKNGYRNIYFVTNNGKLPKCINSQPNFFSILYSDLVGSRTYNSITIESYLHKIDGLSEYYLYFNDDCLLGNYLNISDFIDTSGKLIYYQESNPIVRLVSKFHLITNLFNLGDGGINKARIKLYEKLNLNPFPQPLAHSPKIFKKSMVEEFCKIFEKEIETQRQLLFRSENDFPFIDAFCFYYLKKNKIIYSNKYKTLILCQFDNSLISELYNENITDEKFICIEDFRKGYDVDNVVLKIISDYFFP
uniref:Stealth protein CR2 conserved region 2 domain-containing protein n=1 Tax=viral metagenome TaxID=1070528 RepID=A0A6C0KRC2_9ZZZZ